MVNFCVVVGFPHSPLPLLHFLWTFLLGKLCQCRVQCKSPISFTPRNEFSLGRCSKVDPSPKVQVFGHKNRQTEISKTLFTTFNFFACFVQDIVDEGWLACCWSYEAIVLDDWPTWWARPAWMSRKTLVAVGQSKAKNNKIKNKPPAIKNYTLRFSVDLASERCYFQDTPMRFWTPRRRQPVAIVSRWYEYIIMI